MSFRRWANNGGRSGFTLMELLVATLILGVVIAVIGACLTAGIRVWSEAASFNTVQHEAIFAVSLMEKDLMNAFPFYGVKFVGGTREFSCANLVPKDEEEPRSGADASPELAIGTTRYYFDPGRGTIFRQAWAYPGAEPPAAGAEKIADNVEDMSLRYFRVESSAGGGGWVETWDDPTNLPAVVRINLSFNDRGSPIRVARTVLPPRGGGRSK